MQEAVSLTWGQGKVRSGARERTVNAVTDSAIIERVLSGDTDAFSILTERYQDRIFSAVANYVGNGEDAVDLTQDVFVKAFVGLKSFQRNAAFYTWLYRIAINTAIDFLRKRPAVRVASLDDEALVMTGFEPVATDPTTNPERMAGQREQQAALSEAIQKLSHKLRTALVLHDVEGLSQEEVAAILKVPVGTVKSRVSRARAEIRSMLGDYLEGGR